VKLPGIGPNTAGSIAAFAYEVPAVFIETNIRRVLLHEFFADEEAVPDGRLRPLVEATLDRKYVRDWYYALMDYGAWLARQVPNPNRRSRHYALQSQFEGSLRQIRGQLLRALAAGPQRAEALGISDERLPEALAGLVREGLIVAEAGWYRLGE
jgi:A/G-specific adenine glycosylase